MAIICKLFNSREYRNLKTCILSVSRLLQTQQITLEAAWDEVLPSTLRVIGWFCFLSGGQGRARAVSAGSLSQC